MYVVYVTFVCCVYISSFSPSSSSTAAVLWEEDLDRMTDPSDSVRLSVLRFTLLMLLLLRVKHTITDVVVVADHAVLHVVFVDKLLWMSLLLFV